MDQKILITGGAGFVGCNLADHFLRDGCKITIYDNLSRLGVKRNLKWLMKNHGKSLVSVIGDIRNYKKFSSCCRDSDVIFHTVAQTAVTTSLMNPRDDFEINALGTFNVLEAARNSSNDPIIVYTSTNKVYGDNVNAISLAEKETRYEFTGKRYKFGVPEDFPTDAREHTPYGCSKYTGDLYMRDYHETYGLKTVVFRMSCVYGLHQYGNEDQGWLAHFVISSVLGVTLKIYGDGKQVRDILFIDDLVKAFDLVIKEKNKTAGQVYNIGGGPENTISLLELLTMLEKFGLRPQYSFSDWRLADQKVYISDIRKSREFGWEPTVSPDEGVRRLLDWILASKDFFCQ